MKIPFTKAHGAKNDFLLTWAADAPEGEPGEFAVRLCNRHTGIGADGWILVQPGLEGADAAIRLFNSDGSEPELSGNGTRCAAAFLIDAGSAKENVELVTGAGTKHLRLLERRGLQYLFEMDMGTPRIETLRSVLTLGDEKLDTTILNVGNPQCAVFNLEEGGDWRALGARIERHPAFPNRTNVSFVRPVDEHSIAVQFFERGCGETMSSGTGSTGAAVAAIARGLAKSPIRVLTPAGPIELSWEGAAASLIGPAEIIAKGDFYF